MLTLERLKKIMDQHFRPPFLTKGQVRARFVGRGKRKVLELKIGRRDVWLVKSGEVIASGTDLKGYEEPIPLLVTVK